VGFFAVFTSRCGRSQRLVHDFADRGRAPAALRAAAEAAIDLASLANLGVPADGGADILVAQYVARTDDHLGQLSYYQNSILQLPHDRQEKSSFFIVHLILLPLPHRSIQINRYFSWVSSGIIRSSSHIG
jgi:hypothetical protein